MLWIWCHAKMIYQQQSCTLPRCTSWVFKPILQSLETLPAMPHSTPILVRGEALDTVHGKYGVIRTSPRDSIKLLPAIPHGYHHIHAIVKLLWKKHRCGCVLTHTHTQDTGIYDLPKYLCESHGCSHTHNVWCVHLKARHCKDNKVLCDCELCLTETGG